MLTQVTHNERTISIVSTYKTVCNSVKITGKQKQSVQVQTEKIFNAIASKIDKPKNGFIKKIKALK